LYVGKVARRVPSSDFGVQESPRHHRRDAAQAVISGRLSKAGTHMKPLRRSVSFATLIAAALALPDTSGAQTPRDHPSSPTPESEVTSPSSSTDGGAAIGVRPPLGATEGELRDVDRLTLSAPSAALALSTERSKAPRADTHVFSPNADNWKRARIVGYTLGVIAVCFAAFVAYSVATGT
jgi:hypothetical protein